MKMRSAAIAVLAVFVVMLSSAVIASSDSDAADIDYSKYYYNQLTDGQKAIYDAYAALADSTGAPIATTLEGDDTSCYITVEVEGTLDDAKRAWEASRLDNPMAFWTWSDSDVPSIATSALGFQINMDAQFYHISTVYSSVKDALADINVKGSTDADKVDSINSTLRGKAHSLDTAGSHGVYGITGSDSVHKLSSEGFAALFKALCDRESVGCMQVYGTFAHGDENSVAGWDIVCIGGQFYAVDEAQCNDRSSDAWLCAGRYTALSGNSFGKEHLAFAFNTTTGMDYCFDSELLCNDGYDWPEDTSITALLTKYAPWIIVGVICVILAVAIVLMARKGE